MSSECPTEAAQDAYRSVHGVVWERPGAPRECPKRRCPPHRTYRNSVQASKVKLRPKNTKEKIKLFEKTHNLSTVLAELGVPTTLFGGSSAHGTRQRELQGRRGGRHITRHLYYLCRGVLFAMKNNIHISETGKLNHAFGNMRCTKVPLWPE